MQYLSTAFGIVCLTYITMRFFCPHPEFSHLFLCGRPPLRFSSAHFIASSAQHLSFHNFTHRQNRRRSLLFRGGSGLPPRVVMASAADELWRQRASASPQKASWRAPCANTWLSSGLIPFSKAGWTHDDRQRRLCSAPLRFVRASRLFASLRARSPRGI